MENISIWIILLFILTAILTVWFFYKATNQSVRIVLVILILSIIMSVLGYIGFYQVWDVMPPRFALLIVPSIILMILPFTSSSGRVFIDQINLKWLTILHIIRIPVEIVLYYLFMAKLIPQSMTFEGSNWDVISGISALLMYYLFYVSKSINFKAMLAWNLVCLTLVLNVVITAVLSAKTPFQQFAFDQPNIGVTFFPFVLLPGLIVPIVLFSHLVGIRQLWQKIQLGYVDMNHE